MQLRVLAMDSQGASLSADVASLAEGACKVYGHRLKGIRAGLFLTDGQGNQCEVALPEEVSDLQQYMRYRLGIQFE